MTIIKYDPTKAIRNIRALANTKDGNVTICCEVELCDSVTPSSKMHGWFRERWIICPRHGPATA